MATILDKDIIRETTVKIDGREILVTLTADQKINLKPKGLKSGDLNIGILDLYKYLTAPNKKVEEKKDNKPKKVKVSDDDPMINLTRLRSMAMTAKMDFKVKSELDKVIREITNEILEEE